ncbi:hypothetical protein E4U55_002759 [Claviceps digitariae]|nr:hypothetical protein E4U55_002759 [Claviceps digitariae]
MRLVVGCKIVSGAYADDRGLPPPIKDDVNHMLQVSDQEQRHYHGDTMDATSNDTTPIHATSSIYFGGSWVEGCDGPRGS